MFTIIINNLVIASFYNKYDAINYLLESFLLKSGDNWHVLNSHSMISKELWEKKTTVIYLRMVSTNLIHRTLNVKIIENQINPPMDQFPNWKLLIDNQDIG